MIFRPVWPHQYCNGRTAVIIKLWITSDMPWRQVPDISWYATRYWTIPCFFPCVIIFIGVIQPCKFVNLRCLLEIASSCVLMLPSMAYPCCLYHIIYIYVCVIMCIMFFLYERWFRCIKSQFLFWTSLQSICFVEH
jgi:hypothetical protein